MLVVTCPALLPAPPRRLDLSYGLLLSTDAELASRLALPLATSECQAGYVLIDEHSRVRYRTYDSGWADHAFEQEILLENLAGHHG